MLKAILDALYSFLVDSTVKLPGEADKGLSGAISAEIESTGHSEERAEAVIRGKLLASMHEDIGDEYKFGVEVMPGQDSDMWDCSEKIEDAFRDAGEHIPDGAQYQFDFCRPVTFVRPCDLGFMWSDKRKCIGHVFMFTDRGTVIHAVGGRGLVEDDAERWTSHPRFRGVRRHPCFQRGPDKPSNGKPVDVPGL